jgi:hypothetical protein
MAAERIAAAVRTQRERRPPGPMKDYLLVITSLAAVSRDSALRKRRG